MIRSNILLYVCFAWCVTTTGAFAMEHGDQQPGDVSYTDEEMQDVMTRNVKNVVALLGDNQELYPQIVRNLKAIDWNSYRRCTSVNYRSQKHCCCSIQ